MKTSRAGQPAGRFFDPGVSRHEVDWAEAKAMPVSTLVSMRDQIARLPKQDLPDLDAIMQTPAWWRRVWGVE